MMAQMYQVEPGATHPLGAVPDEQGVNFSLFSEHATSVELLLFTEHNDPEPLQIIQLDPVTNRTFHFWHVYVRELQPGMHYAYRLDGPQDLHGKGNRFNKKKVVIDPYSKGITDALWSRTAACTPDDNVHTSMRCAVIDTSKYDWEGDQPLHRPMSETIIYEMHVGGFTRSPSSGCKHPGTFAGIVEKIPYLQELGITAVELLPIFAFDKQGVSRLNPVNGKPLTDYWGYNLLSLTLFKVHIKGNI
jgi:isoamylase